MTDYATQPVDLGQRSYDILIGPNLLDQPASYQAVIPHKNIVVVTNTTVAPLYFDALRKGLAGHRVGQVVLEDGEQYKTSAAVEKIYTYMLKQGYGRDTTVVALGGGVVGDIAGFAAATYQRGVDFVQVPTTLLAQVDSSVGGKTGINHTLGKNMIGAFHQPKRVIADTRVLQTLPARELSAGLAEVIKYGLIRDFEFFEWLEDNIQNLLALDSAALIHAIRRSCANKAEIVAADEHEGGVRALLNLGHTYGHAIEAAMGYGCWLHGEAVAAGMCMAADTSRRLGWIDEAQVQRLHTILKAAHLPINAPEKPSKAQIKDLMLRDKKALGGKIRLILLETIGKACITTDYKTAMDETLTQYFSH